MPPHPHLSTQPNDAAASGDGAALAEQRHGRACGERGDWRAFCPAATKQADEASNEAETPANEAMTTRAAAKVMAEMKVAERMTAEWEMQSAADHPHQEEQK